jgi:hypothetical protein
VVVSQPIAIYFPSNMVGAANVKKSLSGIALRRKFGGLGKMKN